MKVESIRKGIRISERAPGLARQEVLVPAPEGSNVGGIAAEFAIEIEVHKPLEGVASQGLAEFGDEPRRLDRDGRVCRIWLRCCRKTGRHHTAVPEPCETRIVEEIRL